MDMESSKPYRLNKGCSDVHVHVYVHNTCVCTHLERKGLPI